MTPQGAGAGVLTDEPAEQESDPYLISLARGGDSATFGKLYERHIGAARRLARVLARDPSDADDLVAETFTRVLAAMRAGHGPDTAFRAYLFTTLRHALYDRARRERRVEYTDDLTPYEKLSNIDDPVVKRLETSYAARAFARLPERWRAVLWHTEVEGETPAQVAPLLGLTPNGVAALAYRARERLRQMYLQEHIDITSSPRCHWTGVHLAGYVRAQLARRDRSKVEGHLAECRACRSLHRELTEENSGLRGVLAALLLGTAAPAYLASSPVHAGLAGWFAAIPAGLALLWHYAVDLAAIFAGTIAGILFRLRHLPARLIERFGPGNVAAAGGLVAAGTTGVAVFASVLISGGAPLPSPHPAPHQPTAIAAPTAPALLTPAPDSSDSPEPTRPGPPSPPSPPPLRTTPAPTPPKPAVPDPAPVKVAHDPARARLTAGETGSLAISVRTAESTLKDQILLGVRLPAGIHLTTGDPGPGWICRDGEPVTCEGNPSGSGGIVRLPVRVDRDVTGFQNVAVTAAASTEETVLRVPVAPAGMRLGYAALGSVGFGLGGNTLLGCLPRPVCLAQDNHEQEMLPFLPGLLEPLPPAGLLSSLAGPQAASGARVAVPRGARVLWAGLAIESSSKVAPTSAVVSGPGLNPYKVKGFEKNPTGQAFADITEIVRQAGGGDWWVAVPTSELPMGWGAYAGWSIAVVYDQPTITPGEVAVYVGPRRLAEAQEVSVGLGGGVSPRSIDLALIVWDGDRTLREDSLTLDSLPIGDATNAAGGINPSSLSCGLSPGECPWRTPGLDVLRHKGVTASSGLATLRSGQDPMTVGLLIVLAEG